MKYSRYRVYITRLWFISKLFITLKISQGKDWLITFFKIFTGACSKTNHLTDGAGAESWNKFNLEVGQRSPHGTIRKVLSQRTHVPSIKALAKVMAKVKVFVTDRLTDGRTDRRMRFNVPTLSRKWGTTRQSLTRQSHVFVKHGCPQWQQSHNMAKISKSYILIPTPPPGACDITDVWGTHRYTYSPSSVTVSSPKLYFFYTLWPSPLPLFVSRTELQTDKWTNGQMIWLLLLGREHKIPNSALKKIKIS